MITTFFKNLFTSPMGLLLIPIAFILLILFSSIDDIKDKFGFDTKTNLKGELVSTQKDLTLAQKHIKQLEEQLNSSKESCKIKEDSNKELTDKNTLIDEMIKKAIEDNKKAQIEEKEMVDVETPVLIEDTNIVAIHAVYDNLFGV